MKMVEVKSAELEFGALDWAVARTEGLKVELTPPNYGNGTALVFLTGDEGLYRPSTDWAQGGPLIEKHGLLFEDDIGRYGCWVAEINKVIGADTHLVAACRAIVAAKLGDVVSVPAELINGGGL